MYELRKSRPVVFGICANAGISEPCSITHWREVGTRPTGGVVQIPVSPQCILGLSSIGSSSAMLGELPG